jgi:TPR repeat protein
VIIFIVHLWREGYEKNDPDCTYTYGLYLHMNSGTGIFNCGTAGTSSHITRMEIGHMWPKCIPQLIQRADGIEPEDQLPTMFEDLTIDDQHAAHDGDHDTSLLYDETKSSNGDDSKRSSDVTTSSSTTSNSTAGHKKKLHHQMLVRQTSGGNSNKSSGGNGYGNDSDKKVVKDEVRALYRLATAYKQGCGVDKDLPTACRYFRRAAAQGYAHAQVDLGGCYEEGLGVSVDHQQAFELYLAAARQGLRMGWRSLGNCYMDGVGIKKNWRQARKCWEKAAALGDQSAIRLLERTKHLLDQPPEEENNHDDSDNDNDNDDDD